MQGAGPEGGEYEIHCSARPNRVPTVWIFPMVDAGKTSKPRIKRCQRFFISPTALAEPSPAANGRLFFTLGPAVKAIGLDWTETEIDCVLRRPKFLPAALNSK